MVENSTPLLSKGAYDKLKPFAQVILPALAAFYLTVAPLWGLPRQEEIAATIAAFSALLGAVLALSSHQYKNSDARFDGEIVVDTEEISGLKTGTIQLHHYENPADVTNQDEVVLKVRETTSRTEDDVDVPE
jgi:hypothetical protein